MDFYKLDSFNFNEFKSNSIHNQHKHFQLYFENLIALYLSMRNEKSLENSHIIFEAFHYPELIQFIDACCMEVKKNGKVFACHKVSYAMREDYILHVFNLARERYLSADVTFITLEKISAIHLKKVLKLVKDRAKHGKPTVVLSRFNENYLFNAEYSVRGMIRYPNDTRGVVAGDFSQMYYTAAPFWRINIEIGNESPYVSPI